MKFIWFFISCLLLATSLAVAIPLAGEQKEGNFSALFDMEQNGPVLSRPRRCLNSLACKAHCLVRDLKYDSCSRNICKCKKK